MTLAFFGLSDETVRDVPLAGDTHQIRTIDAFDADEHAHNLTNWEQSYDQMTPGPFHGALTELQLPDMQVFRESTSQGVRQSCCVWPDSIWFGVSDHAGPSRINGRLAGEDSIMVRPGHCEFELVTPSDYAIYGIVIRRNALENAAEQTGCLIDWTKLNGAEFMHVDPGARSACLQTLADLLASDGDDSHPELSQPAVINTLLALLDTSEIDSAVSNSFMRRQRIVAKARDYVLGHRDQVVTVPMLCERLFVSRRTLQYCFDDVLGISPMQYLRLIRLNGARRNFREKSPHAKTVQDVAADWGFSHFSQFSCDYRKLFGQSPSESLYQRSH